MLFEALRDQQTITGQLQFQGLQQLYQRGGQHAFGSGHRLGAAKFIGLGKKCQSF